MRYNRPRRNKYRGSNKNFIRNGYHDLRAGDINNGMGNLQRKSFARNNQNPEKLLEKYNNLAKEASSNGDKILSESYYQYADHFLRVVESRNSVQNNIKANPENLSTKENPDDKKVILKNETNPSFQES